jgi:hypothetical protein
MAGQRLLFTTRDLLRCQTDDSLRRELAGLYRWLERVELEPDFVVSGQARRRAWRRVGVLRRELKRRSGGEV